MSQEQPRPQPPAQDGGITSTEMKDFLELEYEMLNEWARHGEDAAHRIFSFYVTFLTAVLGGFLVITQLLGGTVQGLLLVASAVCGLLVLVGVVFLDALIAQYMRNTRYHIGIRSVRTYFRRDPVIAKVLDEPPALALEADAERPDSFIGGRMPFIKVVLPVSTQQIFIAMMTSLSLGALMWAFAWGFGGIGFRPGATLLGTAVVVVLSFIVQNVFARRGLQPLLDRVQTLSTDSIETGQGDQNGLHRLSTSLEGVARDDELTAGAQGTAADALDEADGVVGVR